jgi:hypothetical protein
MVKKSIFLILNEYLYSSFCIISVNVVTIYNSICNLLDMIERSNMLKGNYFIEWLNDLKHVDIIPLTVEVDLEEIKKVKKIVKYEDKYLEEVRNKKNKYIFSLEEIKNRKEFIDSQNELKDNQCTINSIEDSANEFIINNHLDKLKNNYVMENTPLGNVLMVYNNKRSSFEYYSDNNIPYRFLDTVSRKYVITFNCRPIYVDMEEELKKYEIILNEKEKYEKKQKEKAKEMNNSSISKKPIFAKFKSYNKDASMGRVNTAPPPKNSIPNSNFKIKLDKKDINKPLLLKENANRYSYEGKLSNFNLLKKIDIKLTNKKLGMSFADYKKIAFIPIPLSHSN